MRKYDPLQSKEDYRVELSSPNPNRPIPSSNFQRVEAYPVAIPIQAYPVVGNARQVTTFNPMIHETVNPYAPSAPPMEPTIPEQEPLYRFSAEPSSFPQTPAFSPPTEIIPSTSRPSIHSQSMVGPYVQERQKRCVCHEGGLQWCCFCLSLVILAIVLATTVVGSHNPSQTWIHTMIYADKDCQTPIAQDSYLTNHCLVDYTDAVVKSGLLATVSANSDVIFYEYTSKDCSGSPIYPPKIVTNTTCIPNQRTAGASFIRSFATSGDFQIQLPSSNNGFMDKIGYNSIGVCSSPNITHHQVATVNTCIPNQYGQGVRYVPVTGSSTSFLQYVYSNSYCSSKTSTMNILTVGCYLNTAGSFDIYQNYMDPSQFSSG